MNAKDIKTLAKSLKSNYQTNDPFELAKIFGIRVVVTNTLSRDRKAYTLKIESYPTCIFINGNYEKVSQTVLCAHELGHALLHNDGMNCFGVTKENAFTNVEYEANMFAVALLFEESEFNTQILELNNYLLKTILDFNISVKENKIT